jgi:hypothetical protein
VGGTLVVGTNTHLYVPGATARFSALRLTNSATLWMNDTNAALVVSNDFEIARGCTFDIGGVSGDVARTMLYVGGDLTVRTSAYLRVRSGITNQASADDQELVKVVGTLAVKAGGEIWPYSWAFPPVRTNAGGSVRFEAGTLTVDAGGRIWAKGLGFAGSPWSPAAARGYGPGAGGTTGGAGHGAPGGNTDGGPAYGSSNAPVLAGSGGSVSGSGSQWYAAGGGGLVRILVDNNADINGTINADAGTDFYYGASGASGGGVYLHCHRFSGTGVISACGGSGMTGYNTGNGAGGRIAIVRQQHAWTGTPSWPDTSLNGLSVAPGVTNSTVAPVAGTGTVVWVQSAMPGTVFTFR